MAELKEVLQTLDDRDKEERDIAAEGFDFKILEISSIMGSGTNPFISGSPYSDLIEDNMSIGRRNAREIELCKEKDGLDKIAS